MKQFLCILLSGIMVFVLMACAPVEAAPEDNNSSTGTSSPSQSSTGDPDPSTPSDPSEPPTEPQKQTVYLITSQKQIGEGGYNETWTYDQSGNVLTHKLHSIQGKDDYSYEETFTYDEKGNLIEAKGTAGYIQAPYHYTYTYDDQGKLLQKITHQPNGDTHIGEYIYNSSGQLIEEKGLSQIIKYTYHHNGEVASETFYLVSAPTLIEKRIQYDQMGNQTSYTTYSKGVPDSTSEWTYDEKGNMLTFKAPGVKGAAYAYTYDDAGNRLTEITYIFGEAVKGEIYTYDSQGNMLTAASLDPATMEASSSYKEYTYDSHGNVLTAVYHNGSGTTSVISDNAYTYDAAGNMTYKREGNVETYYTYIALEVPVK